MEKKSVDLRSILSSNIKRQRKLLGLSQEKLAENSEISLNMIKDIEGSRTWVSDKTLIKLASALNIDIYRLFIPATVYEEGILKPAFIDFTKTLRKIRKDVDLNFDEAIKLWGSL